MLQGVQPQVGQLGGFRMAVDRKYPAVVAKLILRERHHRNDLEPWTQRLHPRTTSSDLPLYLFCLERAGAAITFCRRPGNGSGGKRLMPSARGGLAHRAKLRKGFSLRKFAFSGRFNSAPT